MGPSINIKAVDASRENKVVISNGQGEGDKPKEVVSHTQNVSLRLYHVLVILIQYLF